jgi:GTP-sensing pleiotropic transcriptional regulator CodY
MKETQKVSVSVDWSNGIATILPTYSPLSTLGCLIIEKDSNGNIVDEDLDEYITGDMLEYSVGFRFDKDKKDEFINGLKTTFTSSNKPITQNSFQLEHFKINN